MMMRATLIVLYLGLQGAAVVAQAQGINEDPHRRRAVLPSVRAATDCIAREALNEPNIASAAEQRQLRTVLAQPMRRCADELDAMVAMHDRVYFPGFGESFFRGAYLDDLPRAVRRRIAPDLARRASEAEAAQAAQARQDAQPQENKFAIVEPRPNVWVSDAVEEEKRRAAEQARRDADATRRPASGSPAFPPAPAARVTSTREGVGSDGQSGPSDAKTPKASDDDSGNVVLGLLTLIGLIFLARGILRALARANRRRQLMAKYDDADTVERIMAREMWQGMTAEMLRDSWGNPVDVGRDVYKTRTTEVWKYGQTGKNRYKNRIKVENGVVVGFEQS